MLKIFVSIKVKLNPSNAIRIRIEITENIFKNNIALSWKFISLYLDNRPEHTNTQNECYDYY